MKSIMLLKLVSYAQLSYFYTCKSRIEHGNKAALDEYTELVFGSGDGMDTMEQQGEGLDPKIIVVIIIGSVLLFILLCLIVPCLIECRRCKNERKSLFLNLTQFSIYK